MYTLFLDTSALLNLNSKVFEEYFLISQKTLEEIEDIKNNARKDADVKYKARKVARLLVDNEDKYDVVPYASQVFKELEKHGLDASSDNIIVASASSINAFPVIFVTDDINLRFIATKIFGIKSKFSSELNLVEKEEYTGFIEKNMSDEEMAYFYSHLDENIYDLLINQYIIIKSSDNIVDCRVWNGETHRQAIINKNIKSMYFDKLKAKDIYQSCVIDSILNNQLTAISGKAGSGKSLLSLMSVMYLIEKGKYDRLVILFNPTKTRGASDMGYYSGDSLSKSLQNNIGQVLITKFGDPYIIDYLIQQDKLRLVSMADARGMEIRDNEILWITECQNTSIDLIKLCLTRVSDEAKIIIEGDYTSQVDSFIFEGTNNGLKRVIDVFSGHKEFGYVQLQNIWRSRIAELCELL